MVATEKVSCQRLGNVLGACEGCLGESQGPLHDAWQVALQKKGGCSLLWPGNVLPAPPVDKDTYQANWQRSLLGPVPYYKAG